MSRTKKIVIAAAAVVLIAALTLTLCLTLLRKPEYVRDMSEVASRGSFVMKVENQRDILPFEGGESFVFQTYEEFTSNPLSELITHDKGSQRVDGELVHLQYKAKNERYNRDFFEKNQLLVALFEETIEMNGAIVHDVRLEGEVCTVEVYGEIATGSGSVIDEGEALFVCFLEREAWDRDITVSVEVGELFVSESVPNHYYDENVQWIAAPEQEMRACLIADTEQLEQMIADDPYMTGEDLLSYPLLMRYGSSFFEEHDLLVLILPAPYFGEVTVEGNVLTGVDLYSDHYCTPSEKESWDIHYELTSVISVVVEKGFSYTELQYRYCRYYEWEDGLTGRDIETEPVTLTEQTSGTAYRVYAQPQTEA